MEDEISDGTNRLSLYDDNGHDEEFYSSENAVVESFMMDDDEDKNNNDDKKKEDGTTEDAVELQEKGEDDDEINQDHAERLEGKRVIAVFLRERSCYDIVPESSRVVVFDRNIPIRLSYYALVEHEIGAAPLWDPLSQKLSGIITTLDFIEMLRFGYHTNNVLEILDSHSVASWRSLVYQLIESPDILDSLREAGMPAVEAANMAAECVQRKSSNPPILSISPDSTLYDACHMLKKNAVHWLPIVDVEDQVCLGVITHLAVLQYLVTEFCEERRLFEQPIASLHIGTFASKERNMHTATLHTKVYEILDLLSINKISCVPILNGEGKPMAVYARTNVIDIVSHSSIENSLDMSLGGLLFGEEWEAQVESGNVDESLLEMPDRMRMHSCKVTDTLQQVFIKFAQVRVHRLLYVDDDGYLQGVVSLSDLLSYFLDK